jgi:DNA-binding PadR family transcriptional regulator
MSMSINSQTPLRMPISPLQVLLLIQLEGTPKYGYQMIKILKDEFKGTWEPHTGTIYPALKSLEKKGFVETFKKEGVDYYKITEEGKAIFTYLENHFLNSLEFTVKYLSVVFKWMSKEMKQNALSLFRELLEKDKIMTRKILTDFYHNVDNNIKIQFLETMRKRTKERLVLINKLLKENPLS